MVTNVLISTSQSPRDGSKRKNIRPVIFMNTKKVRKNALLDLPSMIPRVYKPWMQNNLLNLLREWTKLWIGWWRAENKHSRRSLWLREVFLLNLWLNLVSPNQLWVSAPTRANSSQLSVLMVLKFNPEREDNRILLLLNLLINNNWDRLIPEEDQLSSILLKNNMFNTKFNSNNSRGQLVLNNRDK